MAGKAGRRAAWDAYLTLAEGLLPALRNGDSDDAINPLLGRVVIHIHRHAPMWATDGLMLVAAASGAVRLLRQSDHDGLVDLSTAMAHRLFLLSVGPNRPHHPGPRNQGAAWNKRSEPDKPPGVGQRRNTRHPEQPYERGFSDD